VAVLVPEARCLRSQAKLAASAKGGCDMRVLSSSLIAFACVATRPFWCPRGTPPRKNPSKTGPSQNSAISGSKRITNTLGSEGPPGHQACCSSFQSERARLVSRATNSALKLIGRPFPSDIEGQANLRKGFYLMVLGCSPVGEKPDRFFLPIGARFQWPSAHTAREASGHHANAHLLDDIPNSICGTLRLWLHSGLSFIHDECRVARDSRRLFVRGVTRRLF
jgi:hypothetical protein